MIYETDIIAALTKRVQKFFPKVKVENQDLKNTFKERPCFFIRTIQTVDTKSAAEYELNSFSFEIIYFAAENNKGYLELLQTKRLLKAVLDKPLKIVKTAKTFLVEIESSNSSINSDDYVLNHVLEIKLEQCIDYSDLNIDLDSDNLTDDENFNREMLEDMEASIFVEDKEIDTFTD